jgi:hypothetical protein
VATHFSRLLRQAWVTVGLFLFPGHHTGNYSYLVGNKNNLQNTHIIKVAGTDLFLGSRNWRKEKRGGPLFCQFAKVWFPFAYGAFEMATSYIPSLK